MSDQTEGAEIGLAWFVGDDRQGDFVVAVIIAVVVGVGGEGHQAAPRPYLEGLHLLEHFGGHQRAQAIDVCRVNGGYPAVLVVEVRRVRLEADVDLGLFQAFEPAQVHPRRCGLDH
ncbi:hypothetical protein D3C80_1311740 [compost metagenome]